MNIYKTKFFARCPVNGARIEYELIIHAGGNVIAAEKILDVTESMQEGMHEEIADRLQIELGETQTLRAHHHGVDIETIRPHIAHWQKPEHSMAAAGY